MLKLVVALWTAEAEYIAVIEAMKLFSFEVWLGNWETVG